MTIDSAVGVSTDPDVLAAVREAADAARQRYAGADPKLVLVYINHTHPPDQLGSVSETVSRFFPSAVIAGGTVNGVIFDGVRHDANHGAHAVGVLALGGAVDVAVSLAPDPSADPAGCGRSLAEHVARDLSAPPKVALMYTPGLSGEPSHLDNELLAGVDSAIPGLRISGSGFVGGMKTDGMPMAGYAFLGDRVERLGVLLIGFGGSIRAGVSLANGSRKLRPAGVVTAAEGSLVLEIDNRTARDALADTFAGDDPDARDKFCRMPLMYCVERETVLTVEDEQGGLMWCHVPVAFTPDGAMVDAFELQPGAKLSVASLDASTCMNAVRDAAGALRDDAKAEDFDVVIATSCAMRGIMLGSEAVFEDETLRDSVRTKQQFGIVANGEVGCYLRGAPVGTGWAYTLLGLVSE